MKPAYYNEIDPVAAQWLRNLITAGHIAPGDVDERSIEDVRPDDLVGYTQCHFFAGIGIWSYALRLAGVPDDDPVWTGSCPCQPFSAAGQGEGFADERHLWPSFFHLIEQRRPAKVFGEQVASSDADPWVDLVCADMERLGYAFGATPFPAASVGAPHIRDRNYWVGLAGAVGDPGGARLEGRGQGLAAADRRLGAIRPAAAAGSAGGLAHPQCERHDGGGIAGAEGSAERGRPDAARSAKHAVGLPGPTNGQWRVADWLFCRDGLWRPVEPGTFPLVDGAPARVGRLRAYGNGINAAQAALFIECVMEAQQP